MLQRSLAISALLCLTGCDNVGKAFDRDFGGGGGDTASTTELAPVGGIARDGRPSVERAFPEGSGWPTTVPAVVVFNESVAENSVAPAQGSEDGPGLLLRVEGTEQALPVTYDFVLGGRAVIMRPIQPLAPDGTLYEVVVTPQLRDIDGIAIAGNEDRVLSTFAADEDESVDDAAIITVLPLDNARDQIRETPIYAVFDKAATITSVTPANFVVRPAGGTAVSGQTTFPLRTATGQPDGRVLCFDPVDPMGGPPPPIVPLAGNTEFEIVVDATIEFGDGVLDFNNRTPFASFRTVAFAQPMSVEVGNPTPNFADKINRANLPSLMLDVETDASAVAGDRLTARIYGLDPDTDVPDDLAFVERTAVVPSDGMQRVMIDFTGVMGSVDKPVFDEGPVTFAVRTQRGARLGGFVRSDPNAPPVLDVTVPSLMQFGPPAGALMTDIVTDQEALALFGVADEAVGAAELSTAATTVTMFGANGSNFLMEPIDLGQLSAPLAYTFTLWDAAGNQLVAPLAGMIHQRGVVTGTMTDTITVEAYDDATFAPVVGATVLLDPGLPVKPAAAGRVVATTDANGRTTFTGLATGRYSVTVVSAAHDLFSMLDVQASFVSVPLRPTSSATARITGTVVFMPALNQTALVGASAFDDVATEAVETSDADPNQIPSTRVRPNRPMAVSAFTGLFEPVALSTFAAFHCQLCGPTATVATAPAGPPGAGGVAQVNLPTLAASGVIQNVMAYTLDFANSTGLGTLTGNPVVRIVENLRGFGGASLAGVGFTQLVTVMGKDFTVTGTYSVLPLPVLAPFAPLVGGVPGTPLLWASTTATDTDGALARHRRWINDPLGGGTFAATQVPGIPTVTVPPGPFTGSPDVTYADRLDPAAVFTGIAFTQIVAVDSAGREWTLLLQDRDGSGLADNVQLPDLQGLSGLAAGAWDIRVENFLVALTTSADDNYVLEQRRRQYVTFARAKSETFTVN